MSGSRQIGGIGLLVTASLALLCYTPASAALDGEDAKRCEIECYWNDGEQIPIAIDPTRFAIRRSDWSGADLEERMRNLGFGDIRFDRQLGADTALFRLSNASGTPTIDEAVELAETLPGYVDGFVTPVFMRPAGGPPFFLLEDYFYALWSPGSAPGDRVPEQVAELVSDIEFDSLGKRGLYRYQSDTAHALELLRSVNRLAEANLADYAHAVFLGFGAGPAASYYPTDPLFGHVSPFAGPQWGLHHVAGQWPSEPQTNLDVNAPDAWGSPLSQFGSNSVLVLVMDNGVQRPWSPADFMHPCYEDPINPPNPQEFPPHPDLPYSSLDFGTDTCPEALFTKKCAGRPTNGCDNHGTWVAGVVRAAMGGSPAVGGAGLAPGVRLASAKVFGIPNPTAAPPFCVPEAYEYPEAAVRAAITSAESVSATYGLRVVTNLSANNYMENATLTGDFVDSRLDHGFVHFVSAGNVNDGLPVGDVLYPATLEAVNAVTALDHGGASPQLYDSDTGTAVDFTAPGRQIVTTDRTGNAGGCPPTNPIHLADCMGTTDYYRASGTSFASPVVAAIAALVLSENPDLTGPAVEWVLQESATDLGPPGRDNSFGWGLPRADAAVALARDLIFFDGFETGNITCWTGCR